MRVSCILPSCKGKRFGIAPQIVVQLVCLVFACTSSLFGQSLRANEYVNVSVGSNGTIYATGITDAGNMSIHSATVTTTITSPRGRRASAYNSVSSGGYVRADTSLIYDDLDIGEYFSNAVGSAYCRVLNVYAYPSASGSILNYTVIQHNYPKNPLPKPCWISDFFDKVRDTGPHHAEDVVYDDGTGTKGAVPPFGTTVTAMEAGTVVAAQSDAGPAPYPACKKGTPRPPGNHVKIHTTDGYTTLYFHMKPSVKNGDIVTAGQTIGTLDNSGCQSHAHLHVGRKDSSGHPVNFTLPCTNPTPSTFFDDGLVDDAVPDDL